MSDLALLGVIMLILGSPAWILLFYLIIREKLETGVWAWDRVKQEEASRRRKE